jgi:branched-chain amino acid transport system substrate-binding protein
MAGRGVTRRRRGAVGAILAFLLVAGCGKTEGITAGGNVIGETLTVYSLLPQPGTGVSRDIVDAERLALQQAGGRAGRFKVNFASLDLTGDATGDELPGRVASAARQAIGDAQIIAVIGDLDAATARVTVPLLNSSGVLHVSPGVTDPGFTVGGAPGEPERHYPAGRRSFFPLPADDVAQARALAGALRGRVLVEEETSPAGRRFGAPCAGRSAARGSSPTPAAPTRRSTRARIPRAPAGWSRACAASAAG